ncbi:MAG: BamA/TamA family outer membrane protein, partial [Deltaproteobacteria bacterium]|nr:BamA/TamA family outer membrane protein [Deltaproteobacteria bacterium]
VDEALDKLLEELAELGYPDARLSAAHGKGEEPVVERRLGRYRMELEIPVDAGLQTSISFLGNHHLREQALRDRLEKGRRFRTHPDAVEQGVIRVVGLYRRAGFFHARVRCERRCVDEQGTVTVAERRQSCGAGTARQDLRFHVTEGPPLTIADVIFEGNEHLDDDDLKRELMAFMLERNDWPDMFQPVDTSTVDDLGVSDKRPAELGRSKGAGAPLSDTKRIYVPELYAEAMEHLTGVYQEEGFLAAEVSDLCHVGGRPRMRLRRMRFQPFAVDRDDGGSEVISGEGPCVLISEELDQLLVIITVREGPRTLLNQIEFEGNEAVSSRDLLEASGYRVGDPYNEYQLRAAARELERLYRRRGHMFVTIKESKSFSPSGEQAAVTFTVREGPEVRVGRIRVEGAESTSKRLIRERLEIAEGKLLTPEAMEESRQRLMELGIFSGATVQMVSPEESAPVKNVKIQVTESKPQYLELRGGLATVEGVRAGFEYGIRNLFGWAITARVRARANYRVLFLGNPDFERRYHEEMTLQDQIERHLLLSVGQAHFPGTRGLLGWNVDATNERVNEPAFSADRNTVFLSLKSVQAFRSRFRRALVLEARTGLEDSTLELPEEITELTTQPQFQRWSRMPDGESTFWVTGLKLTVDLRDNPITPSYGVFLSLGGDLVRSLANFGREEQQLENTGETVYVDRLSNLIRAQGTLSGYVPLVGTDVVLALSVSAGYVFHLQDDSTTWADRYFYMGGIDTLRGFAEEAVVPEDIYQDWKSRLRNSSDEASELLGYRGGEAMFLLRAEFRYPLTSGFYGAVFGEAGNIWRKRGSMDLLSTEPFDVHLRPVTGGG